MAYFSALYVVNRPLSGLVDVFYCLTLALASLAAALVVSLTLPALSRFSFKVPQLLGFTLRLARRFPLRALALALMSLAAAALCWIFPPALPLLPGGLCLASTWLIEPMFRSFMPPREDFPPGGGHLVSGSEPDMQKSAPRGAFFAFMFTVLRPPEPGRRPLPPAAGRWPPGRR